MGIYISNLIITMIIAIIFNKKKINKWVTIILVTIPLVCVSGFRWRVGTDFAVYYNFFNEIPNYSLGFLLSSQYSDFIPFERGFSVLIWIIGVINKNPQFIVFITSLINVTCVVYSLKKYSNFFSLSIYLYITTMMYYSAFNGIRQWIASVIIFLAFKYVVDRNFKRYLIFVLIASLIHISALIMIPVYFIVNFKPFSKQIIIIVAIFAIIAMSLTTILASFEDVVSGTRYENYTSISKDDDGVNIFRVLVAMVPFVISLVYYNKLKEDEETKYLINFSMLNFLVLVLAMQSTVIARFTMYFELYNLLLYPKFLKVLKREEKYIFLLLLCICFFIYMVLLLPVDSNLLPYRTFWTK